MAKNVVLLVMARGDLPTDAETGRPNRWGQVVGQFPVNHNFGRCEQPSAGRFVHVRLDGVDDNADFTELYDTGEKKLGPPDPETGVPTVIPVRAKRWYVPPTIIDEIRAANGARRTLNVVELEDRKPAE
jgi:hypothetical protein